MSIIRGERIFEVATLTSSKELFLSEEGGEQSTFLAEECAKAFQRGREEGERLGYEKALHENKALLDVLQILAQKILEHKKHLFEYLKPEIIDFATAMCETVIRQELSQPENLIFLINSLLKIRDAESVKEQVKVILSPADLSLIEGLLDQVHGCIEERIIFKAEATMRRGDCKIESPSGLIHHSVSRELAEIAAATKYHS